ncbi:MAG: IS256 family transposase [Reichenbachiella sp.]
MNKLNIPPELIEQLKTQSDVNDFIGGIYKEVVEKMLQSEMDEHLGYGKNERDLKETTNFRNGKSTKRLKTDVGEVMVDIPRDREANFDPVVVPKHERVSQKVEDAVISFYAKGMTTSDIEEQVKEIYGIKLSASSVSNITERIIDHMNEWQSRPLDSIYFVLWVDGIVFKVRHNGKVINKTVYIVIGLSNTGHKDILGLWISETESAAYWMNVFSDIQARGVEDVLIVCSDNLKGLTEGIQAIFPQSQNQICVLHQIRNASRYVVHKDRREFNIDMKPIYQAPTLEEATRALELLESKWYGKYPHSIKSWKKNWQQLTVYYEYPTAIRRIIYTTNVIESFNSIIRRQTAKKTTFPTDDALFKCIYLAIEKVKPKWSSTICNWGLIANQFIIKFENRCRI